MRLPVRLKVGFQEDVGIAGRHQVPDAHDTTGGDKRGNCAQVELVRGLVLDGLDLVFGQSAEFRLLPRRVSSGVHGK